MQFDKPFDATAVKPSQANEVLPVAWYPVTITGSESKPTAKKNGSFLALEMTIIDGEHKGRKIFDNLNLVNTNPQAVEIANATLSAICHATGVLQVSTSAQLHNIPLEVKLGMAKPTTDYPEPSNEVKGYRKLGGAVTTGATAAPTALPPAIAPAAAATAQPWAAAAEVPAVATAAIPAQAAPVAAAPAPTSAPAPVAAAPAPAPVVAEPVKTMTEKAAGATYEAFVAQGWKDEQMIEQGFMVLVTPAPVAAVAPVPAAAPVPVAAGVQPPWAQ